MSAQRILFVTEDNNAEASKLQELCEPENVPLPALNRRPAVSGRNSRTPSPELPSLHRRTRRSPAGNRRARSGRRG